MGSQENKYTRRRLQSSYISTVVSISLVLFTLGLLAMIIVHAKKLSDYFKENIELSVILRDNAKEVEISQLQKTLDASDYVKSTEYVTKEEAATRVQEKLGEDFIGFLGYNPLLPSIDVHLHAPYAQPDSIAWIRAEILQNKQVKEIFYEPVLVEIVNKNLRTITLVLLLFSSMLFIIALALINNTIRLALYSKRFLIKSMQLVGATKGFIRSPFLASAFFQGLYGGVAAICLLIGLLYLIQQGVPDLMELQDAGMIGVLFASIIIIGILIACGSTFLAVRKYLKLNMDELYQ